MNFKIETNINIEVSNCNLKLMTISFLSALGPVFQSFVTQILLYFFEKYYTSEKLAKMLSVKTVNKKTTTNKTKFKTLFGNIWVPQIQVRVTDFEGKKRQMTITRTLLGVGRKLQIPDFMKELMGWIGSVCTYRVGHKIVESLTGFKCSLMSVWSSVQWYANTINLELSPDGTNEFEADGTGVPTTNSGKRGSELKKVFQRKKNGKLHLVGIAIGKYKDMENWKSALCSSLKVGLKQFGKIILASDGDKSITNIARSISKNVKIQKDLWHVFHQLKYYLWKDKVPKKMRSNIVKLVYRITLASISFSSKKRLRILDIVKKSLRNKGYKSTATYLQSAMDGFYTYEIEGNSNIYTTKTERSMRTTNQRINVGVWSDKGALNASKIRLAYYYNGISPLDWKK